MYLASYVWEYCLTNAILAPLLSFIMAPLSMSKTEARLFDQVCETLQVSSEIQKNMLKSFIYDDLNSDWTDLVSLMEANGPLSMLSEEQLK